MRAMTYENIIRNAWGRCDRWGDPLKLANTDLYYDKGCINTIKLGISYSLRKVLSDLSENDARYSSVNKMFHKIMNASTFADIDKLLDESSRLVLDCTND